jgi:hypothetical protein
MRYVTDDQLHRISRKWKSHSIERHFVDAGPPIYLPNFDNYKPAQTIMFQCVRCHTHYILDECGNCGNGKFEAGESNQRLGVFCKACHVGLTFWTCGNCGTQNPVSKTLFLPPEKKCFIATAACGSDETWEVAVLRTFRDQTLCRSGVGRALVSLYYRLSPPLAHLISASPLLAAVVRARLITPIALRVGKKQRETIRIH